MGDAKRAHDHFRWSERYSRYGETEKASAHMERALHYGKALGFGTGSKGPETDIVFILGPLNQSAVDKIRDSIEKSTKAGNKVEVYMQAFTEPGPVFNAPNLLPMNFNQYSSDTPTILVDIIQENSGKENVEFYIFPTQTTKNDHFWKNGALPEFTARLKGLAGKIDIDELILTSIVAWLKKDEDISKGGDYELKDKTFGELQAYAQDPAKIQSLPGAQAIFDPFCAVCAAHKKDGTFKSVPGSGLLVAHRVSVSKNYDLTEAEAKEGLTDSTMQRPRFRYISEGTNCFAVTWSGDDPVGAANRDGAAYIEELWSSFLKKRNARGAMRTVGRVLIVQDYYDYDNKMSVWYILRSFDASVIELYSVTKPVAEKDVMRAMREKQSAFTFAGGFPLKPHALSKEAMGEWKSDAGPTYPVAAPVFTETNFNGSGVTVEGTPLTLKRFKEALEMTEARHKESEAESGHIAYTWYRFMQHMLDSGMVGNPKAALSVTNGGYTARHGLNPAMHTIVEDWYKDDGLAVGAEAHVKASEGPKRAKTA